MTLISEAVALASDLHAGQKRRNGVPYLSHLLGTGYLVSEDYGTEVEVAAAILHDSAEDAGGLSTLRLIEKLCGAEVTRIVTACSDTFESQKAEWWQRKINHLALISNSDESVLRVFSADKAENLSTNLRVTETLGRPDFSLIRGGFVGAVWYYVTSSIILSERLPNSFSTQLLNRTLTQLGWDQNLRSELLAEGHIQLQNVN